VNVQIEVATKHVGTAARVCPGKRSSAAPLVENRDPPPAPSANSSRNPAPEGRHNCTFRGKVETVITPTRNSLTKLDYSCGSACAHDSRTRNG